MATDPQFIDYLREKLHEVPDLAARKMFGEYALYVGSRVVALVCDNQLFVKPTTAGRALLAAATEAPPYPGAKPCFLIDEQLDDAEFMAALIGATARELPLPKPKPTKKPRQPKRPNPPKTKS